MAKSVNLNRIQENLTIFDFKLTEDDMNTIKELDTKNSLFFNHQDPNTVDMFLELIKQRADME